ncbi:MAG TPA: extracellular solute-binding protein [Gemmataceae bacterium]|nr:extracellular solute-binding protein [Gemmataceae bacterium]
MRQVGVLCVWLIVALCCGCPRSEPRVVLYCAQDEEFAVPLLDEFRQRHGLPVAPKYDTEADKSVSLYQELVSEKNRPRCDVFWNNEILSTIRLQQQGLLESYESPVAKPYPAEAKAADHTWHAFATRARILLVNTRLIAEKDRPYSLLDLTAARWRGRAAMARPQFGTSATQAACLFQVLGSERAKTYYLDLKKNGIHIAPGNKQVAEWVGKGRTPQGKEVVVGVTDTDDAMAEVQAGHDVAIVYPDRDAPADSKMGTLFIPNTLAILKGSPNPEGARRLVDYLLSPETEKRLAESESHQIPLNPETKATLPRQIETPRTVHAMRVDFAEAAKLWEEVQTFVRQEFAKP